jgi:LEA14-like dessication related protein
MKYNYTTKTFIILITITFLYGCAALSTYKEKPRLSLVHMELSESTIFEQRYKLKFRIQNPNRESIPVAGMHFDLEVNGKQFMSGLSNQSITIPAFSDTVIDATGTSTLFGIARQLQDMQKNENMNFSYRLTGKLSLKDHAFSIPFDYKGAFNPE